MLVWDQQLMKESQRLRSEAANVGRPMKQIEQFDTRL
jgi:hypothetical protein